MQVANIAFCELEAHFQAPKAKSQYTQYTKLLLMKNTQGGCCCKCKLELDQMHFSFEKKPDKI